MWIMDLLVLMYCDNVGVIVSISNTASIITLALPKSDNNNNNNSYRGSVNFPIYSYQIIGNRKGIYLYDLV